MRFFGFLGAPFRFIERVTGERASRQKAAGAKEQYDQEHAKLNAANAKAAEVGKRLKQMLDELGNLDRQQQVLAKDYKTRLRSLEYEEQRLKGLGEHYTKATQAIQAKGNELLTRKSQLEEKSAKLEGRATSLEQKLKELAGQASKIDDTEIKTLSEQFQQKYAAAEANREKLKGVPRETSPELFKGHQKLVKELKDLRASTEEAIKLKHAGLSETHRQIAAELSRLQKDYQDMEAQQRDIQRGQEKLERKKARNDSYQKALEPALEQFAKSQEDFQKQAQGLKIFQQKITGLEKGYAAKKGEAENLQKELVGINDYQQQLAARLNALGQEVESQAKRYQERAGRGALFKAAAGGLAGMGIGAGLGLGGMLKNLAVGLGALGGLNKAKADIEKNLQKFGAYTDFAADYHKAGGIPDWNKTPLNRVEFKSRVFDTKVKMPEFGGLGLSIRHFEMPTLPKLSELPPLSETLGKIRSLEDIANLGILPGSTARSTNRSLLNPQLMQTFQALMRARNRIPPSNENRKKNGGALPRPRGLHYGH